MKTFYSIKGKKQEVEAYVMTIMEWVFTVISVFWLCEFLIFRNRGVGQGDSLEKRTFVAIFGVLIGTIGVAYFLQELKPFQTLSFMGQVVGIIFLATGVFLRFWGILHLKSQFTRYVTVREGDEIVSTGPYRKLRHPLYTGLFLITLGMALFFGSLVATIIGGIAMVWALLQRINYEERLLVEKFGADYELWMKKRAR
ncbi:MAG: isoprenylcysteine carboxylmethyltransferase family protein, partial [Planococcus donghaensis]